MNNCKGLMGKIFGHCFVSRIQEKIPLDVKGLDLKGNLVDILDKLTHKKYVIICKRCGEKTRVKK